MGFRERKSPTWWFFQKPWSRCVENVGVSANIGPVLTHQEPGHFLKNSRQKAKLLPPVEEFRVRPCGVFRKPARSTFSCISITNPEVAQG